MRLEYYYAGLRPSVKAQGTGSSYLHPCFSNALELTIWERRGAISLQGVHGTSRHLHYDTKG